MKRILIRHLGNMGDHIFFVPPALRELKREYPGSHITLVTAWGYKQKHGFPRLARRDGRLRLERQQLWGARNQGGFCISLMMHNPHIDQLVHYSDTELSPKGTICQEEGHSYPTWNADEYKRQKESGSYDAVYELDFGLKHDDNPIAKVFEHLGLSYPNDPHYELHLSPDDESVAQAVMKDRLKPRVVLLEGIAGATTRGWDPGKVRELEARIKQSYGVEPIHFGSSSIPTYQGRKLTLRENIATLKYCDVAIGVMSGPLHFAAAVGLPTITLYCDQPLHRAAPAYFQNKSISNPAKRHHSLLGPSPHELTFLKSPTAPRELTLREVAKQHYSDWTNPGRQATKSCLSVITVDEVMRLLTAVFSPSKLH